MNMQKIVRTLVSLWLLAGSWQGSYAQSSYAQSDFQPMAGGVKPLYTTSMSEYKKFVRLSCDYSPQLYRVTGQASASRPATSIASPNYTVRAWRGNLSEVGAISPTADVTTAPAFRRSRPTEGDIEPSMPLGDTPYWLFAVLLIGYCCYRRTNTCYTWRCWYGHQSSERCR